MTPRNLRRAAERKAAKLARKANPISPAQQAANQANAQFSTGPRTEAGKQTSRLNALKSGLTGQTVLLPTDDLAAYQALLQNLLAEYAPANEVERTLLQSLVDTTWRLQRIVTLEFALYAKGSLEFAEQFADLEPALRSQMILAETYLQYEKSLRNLNTQESRLRRQLVKETIELRRLQNERLELEASIAAAMARRAAQTEQPKPNTLQPLTENGFEFANNEAENSDDRKSLENAA